MLVFEACRKHSVYCKGILIDFLRRTSTSPKVLHVDDGYQDKGYPILRGGIVVIGGSVEIFQKDIDGSALWSGKCFSNGIIIKSLKIIVA